MAEKSYVIVTLGEDTYKAARDVVTGWDRGGLISNEPHSISILSIDASSDTKPGAVKWELPPGSLTSYITDVSESRKIDLLQWADISLLQGIINPAKEIEKNKMLGRLFLWHSSNVEAIRSAFASVWDRNSSTLSVIVVAPLEASRYSGILPELGYVLRAVSPTPIAISALFWTKDRDATSQATLRETLYEINHYNCAGNSYHETPSFRRIVDPSNESSPPYDDIYIVVPDTRLNSTLELLLAGKIDNNIHPADKTLSPPIYTVLATYSQIVPFTLVRQKFEHLAVKEPLDFILDRYQNWSWTKDDAGLNRALEATCESAQTATWIGGSRLIKEIASVPLKNELYRSCDLIMTKIDGLFGIDPLRGATQQMGSGDPDLGDYLIKHALELETHWIREIKGCIFTERLLKQGGLLHAQDVVTTPTNWYAVTNTEIEQRAFQEAQNRVIRSRLKVKEVLDKIGGLGNCPFAFWIFGQKRKETWMQHAGELQKDLTVATKEYISECLAVNVILTIINNQSLREQIAEGVGAFTKPYRVVIEKVITNLVSYRAKLSAHIGEYQVKIDNLQQNAIVDLLEEVWKKIFTKRAIGTVSEELVSAITHIVSEGELVDSNTAIRLQQLFENGLNSCKQVILSATNEAILCTTLEVLKAPTVSSNRNTIQTAFDRWLADVGDDDKERSKALQSFHSFTNLPESADLTAFTNEIKVLLGNNMTIAASYEDDTMHFTFRQSGLTITDLDRSFCGKAGNTKPSPPFSRIDLKSKWLDPRIEPERRSRAEEIWLRTLLFSSIKPESWLKSNGDVYIIITGDLLNNPDCVTISLPHAVAFAAAYLARPENAICLSALAAYEQQTLLKYKTQLETANGLEEALANIDLVKHGLTLPRVHKVLNLGLKSH